MLTSIALISCSIAFFSPCRDLSEAAATVLTFWSPNGGVGSNPTSEVVRFSRNTLLSSLFAESRSTGAKRIENRKAGSTHMLCALKFFCYENQLYLKNDCVKPWGLRRWITCRKKLPYNVRCSLLRKWINSPIVFADIRIKPSCIHSHSEPTPTRSVSGSWVTGFATELGHCLEKKVLKFHKLSTQWRTKIWHWKRETGWWDSVVLALVFSFKLWNVKLPLTIV